MAETWIRRVFNPWLYTLDTLTSQRQNTLVDYSGNFLAVLFFEICFVSPYVHARDLLSRGSLKDRMKPRLTYLVESRKEFMVSEKTFYFRPMLN